MPRSGCHLHGKKPPDTNPRTHEQVRRSMGAVAYCWVLSAHKKTKNRKTWLQRRWGRGAGGLDWFDGVAGMQYLEPVWAGNGLKARTDRPTFYQRGPAKKAGRARCPSPAYLNDRRFSKTGNPSRRRLETGDFLLSPRRALRRSPKAEAAPGPRSPREDLWRKQTADGGGQECMIWVLTCCSGSSRAAM